MKQERTGLKGRGAIEDNILDYIRSLVGS